MCQVLSFLWALCSSFFQDAFSHTPHMFLLVLQALPEHSSALVRTGQSFLCALKSPCASSVRRAVAFLVTTAPQACQARSHLRAFALAISSPRSLATCVTHGLTSFMPLLKCHLPRESPRPSIPLQPSPAFCFLIAHTIT